MNTDELLKSINERLEALGKPATEEELRQMVNDQLQTLTQDEGFVRKMRFPGKPEPALVGSKFARWDLSIQDIEFLHELQNSLKGQKRVDEGFYQGPSEELDKCFRSVSDAVYMTSDEVKAIDHQAIDGMYPRIPRQEFQGRDARLVARGGASAWQDTALYQRMVRAMDTAESGYGSQLIGAQYVGSMWEAARNNARVFPLIGSFEMTASTAYLPVEVDFPELLYVTESTASNSSNYTTSKTGSNRVSVTAAKFVLHQMWSGEMEEDSIIPYVPFLRRQAELSLAFYADSLALNGDTETGATGNINCDDAAPSATKHYLAFQGIRHACIGDNTANFTDVAAAITFDKLLDMRTLAIDATYKHDWGHPNDPNMWVYICDPWTGDYIDKLDEFVSVDKFGSNAVVLTGQVGRVGQHPLIRSIALSRTEADGKVNTAGSTSKGNVLAFNRAGCVVGWRRRVRTETERIPATDQTRIVHSLRMGLGRFTPTGAASGIEWAALAYDITL